jgi:hypothetical protein
MQLQSFTGFRANAPAPRPLAASARPAKAVSQRQQLSVRASTVAAPAKLDVKALDGQTIGSETLSLRVAEADKAKGLVHRYVVMVQRNARSVRVGRSHTMTHSPHCILSSLHPHNYSPALIPAPSS